LTDNPYRPTKSFYAEETTRIAIHWKPVLIGFALGLIGGCVCREIEDSRVANRIVVAALSIATSIPFIFFDEDPFDWSIAIYYLIEFVLAGAFKAAWSRRVTR